MKRLHSLSMLIVASMVLTACVPAEIEAQCKRRAIQSGFGKCSVEKGRQNSSGVWLLKLNCSRGTAGCANNSAGSIYVREWTSTSEFIYRSD